MQQQGDVLLKKIEQLPNGAVCLKPKGGRWVLAEGEATGHAHAIEQIDDCTVHEKDGVLYIAATNAVKLQHEEHHAQTIEPGIYEIGIVQEYDYLTEMARSVVD